MIQNFIDSPYQKKSEVSQNRTFITRPTEINSFLSQYCILQLAIDLAVLLLNLELLKYTIPKIVIDGIIAFLLLKFSDRFGINVVTAALALIKIGSAISILGIGNSQILIIAFSYEQIDTDTKLHTHVQHVMDLTVRIACLIVIALQQQILGIIILSCSLLFSLYKAHIYYKYHQSSKSIDHSKQEEYIYNNIQSNLSRSNAQIINRDNIWLNRMEQIPICLIMISQKDLSITFKNQCFYVYFNKGDKTSEEIEDLILNKIEFLIVQQYNEDTKNIQTAINISKKKTLRRSRKLHDQEDGTSIHKQISQKQTLSTILNNLKEGKLTETINTRTKSLDLFSQYNWEDGTKSTYTGQVLLNNEDDEIIFTLFDISQQQEVQEEMIKGQYKSQIVQSFSHELRTPLNSALNFLECSLREQGIPEKIKEQFIQPANCSLRLQSYLINDIIDFTSFYNNDLELDIRDFKLQDLIDEVGGLFSNLSIMKHVHFSINLFEIDQQTIATDFNRLIQILTNILQNSIKYSDEGSISLKLTSYQQNMIKFTISDQGRGIESEKLAQIQEMLIDVEQRKGFTNTKSWHGFGLLISSMLLTKLCPQDYKSLLIRSGGQQKGTKVTFYIQNHLTTFLSQSYSSKRTNQKITTIRFQTKAISLRSASQQFSLNGTLLQLNDLQQSNRRLNLNSQMIRKVTNDNSLFTESFQMDLCDKMDQIPKFQKYLITDLAYLPEQSKTTDLVIPQENKNVQSQKSSQKGRVFSYKSIKMKEEFESEKEYKSIIKKLKCNCRRILSVDDEIFNQQSIKFLLNQQGLDVMLAFNGEEALQIIKSTQKCSKNCILYQLILMDYQMPVMDGITTTKKMKQLMDDLIIPQIHIIGLTAFNTKSDIENCIIAGMSDVLSKPLKIKELFEIIKIVGTDIPDNNCL